MYSFTSNSLNFKYERLSKQIQEAITVIINKSGREELEFITITEVEITKDMQDTKIYVSTLRNISDDELLKILSKNSSYIKRELVKAVQMRKVPELIFKSDTSLENYNKLDEILHEESKKFTNK